MDTSATTQSLVDELARKVIRAYLAGERPNVSPADCGPWSDRIQILANAYDRGGKPQVQYEYNLMAYDYELAALLAGESERQAEQQDARQSAPPVDRSARMLNVQYLLDQGADDEGNSQCLTSLFGDEFVYTKAYGYLWWSGTHWTSEGADEALGRAATYVLKQRYCEAAKANGSKHTYERTMRACYPSARHVRDCLYLFQMGVAIDINKFDSSPELLNCANGVLNLATGQLTPHAPEQRFTYCLPVEYDPGADQTMWRQFLADVVGGGQEVIDYLQLAVGYSLTGYTREECLFYIYGPTRSGKGTFTETLLAILPKPLAMEVDFTTFTADRGADTQNFDLAPLKPARLIIASESNKYQSLNTGKIKSLTGGNEVYCALKRRDHFSYRPQYKMWLVSNHPVNADVDDDALWHRIKVIEFPNSFADKEDTSLKLRMRQLDNLKGVFAWAAEGARKWFELGSHGLGPRTPQAVSTITKQQRADLDYVQAWIDECCEYSPAHWSANEIIYRSYRDWSVDNGVETKKIRTFILALKAKGILVSQPKWFQGIGGKPDTTRRGIIGIRVL